MRRASVPSDSVIIGHKIALHNENGENAFFQPRRRAIDNVASLTDTMRPRGDLFRINRSQAG